MDNNSFNNDEPDYSSGTSGQDFSGRPVTDREYYFNLVVFKVENVIFRVPRNGFDVAGTTFDDMFSLPVNGSNIEGSSDHNPIVLPVKKEYFKGFLRSMYAINGRQLTEKDWLGALDLSTMWRFSENRRRAIQGLDNWIKKQNAKEAVLLAKKYCIAHWLTDAYSQLLQQPTSTADELAAPPFSLDWETIARLFSAREAIRVTDSDRDECYNCGRSRSRYGNCSCAEIYEPTSAQLKVAIENEFKLELAGIHKGNKEDYPDQIFSGSRVFFAGPRPDTVHNGMVEVE